MYRGMAAHFNKGMKEYKFTDYFEQQVLQKRPYFKAYYYPQVELEGQRFDMLL